MADQKLTARSALATTPADGDLFHVVDVSDTTDSAEGTSKKIAYSNVKYTHPNHSGDVTSSGDGATTIANEAVTLAKMADLAEDRIIGRISAGAGVPESLQASDVRTMINVADGANAYTHPNHSGDVTSVADGATTIASNAVTTAKILDANVTLAKMANLAQNTIIGRVTASTGVPEALSAANVRTIINVADGATANAGDVTGPATNTDNKVPQWDGADSKALKDGITVGTGANNLVQLDASSKLPAVDGSQLTNLPSGFSDPMTTRGDMIIRGESATTRLAKGTSGQVLTMGANEPEWVSKSTATASFANADLSSGVYRFNHALGIKYITIAIYDNSDKIITPDEITAIDTNNIDIDLSSFAPITGDYNVRGVA